MSVHLTYLSHTHTSYTHTHTCHSPYHSAPLKLHMGGGGWGVKGIVENTVGAPTSRDIPSLSEPSTHHQGPMYDSVFVLSSGRITSVGPQGEFNWQVGVCVCGCVGVRACVYIICF